MFSHSRGSVLLKHWRKTHNLDVCSAMHIKSSYLLKHWKGTYILDMCSILLVVLICSKTGEGLTP